MTTKTYDRQTAKLIARIAENIPEMPGDVMQGWIDNPRALQMFLAGLYPPQEVGGNCFIRPADLDPAAIFGSGWKYSNKKGDTDDRSLVLTEVDFSKVLLETCLKEGEQRITGEEKLKRLIESGNIRLDPRFGAALFQEEGHTTLERLNKEHGVTCLDFFGKTLVRPGGGRCVLCLYRRGGGWCRGADWLDGVWNVGDFSVGLVS
jgi:hypothetical protein